MRGHWRWKIGGVLLALSLWAVGCHEEGRVGARPAGDEPVGGVVTDFGDDAGLDAGADAATDADAGDAGRSDTDCGGKAGRTQADCD